MTTKPTKQIVPLAAGGMLAGENVGGAFTAFDCIGWQGQDARLVPLRERLAMRNELCRAGQIPIVPEVTERGGEFLESILRAGGEGAVFKSWDSTFLHRCLRRNGLKLGFAASPDSTAAHSQFASWTAPAARHAAICRC